MEMQPHRAGVCGDFDENCGVVMRVDLPFGLIVGCKFRQFRASRRCPATMPCGWNQKIALFRAARNVIERIAATHVGQFVQHHGAEAAHRPARCATPSAG